MLYQRSRPVILKLPEMVIPGDRTAFSDAVPSPTSPLERNFQSPKGWKNRESDGVGLGIVAALEKAGGEIPAKFIVGNLNFNVSAPIAIGSPKNKSNCDGKDCDGKDCEELRWREVGFFCASPPRFTEEVPVFRMADFLSYCYLCRKRLHGKDIYMYRGEKAFCSMECRYQQIVSDECQEKCGSQLSKPSDMSSSPYSDGRLFFTGIVAA